MANLTITSSGTAAVLDIRPQQHGSTIVEGVSSLASPTANTTGLGNDDLAYRTGSDANGQPIFNFNNWFSELSQFIGIMAASQSITPAAAILRLKLMLRAIEEQGPQA
jgi:hypothetical protein